MLLNFLTLNVLSLTVAVASGRKAEDRDGGGGDNAREVGTDDSFAFVFGGLSGKTPFYQPPEKSGGLGKYVLTFVSPTYSA